MINNETNKETNKEHQKCKICEYFKYAKTFEDLCKLGAMYANDEINEYPGWSHVSGQNLYEMAGRHEWIKYIICDYNTNGFFTRMSQPGNKCIILETQQRASVDGFMKKNMAMYVYEKLKNNENFVILTSLANRDIPFEHRVRTIPFKNNVPMFKQLKRNPNMSVTHFGVGINYPLFEEIFKTTLLDADPKLFEKDNIVQFSIMDLRWNYNDELWTTLLDCIKEYNNVNGIKNIRIKRKKNY